MRIVVCDTIDALSLLEEKIPKVDVISPELPFTVADPDLDQGIILEFQCPMKRHTCPVGMAKDGDTTDLINPVDSLLGLTDFFRLPNS